MTSLMKLTSPWTIYSTEHHNRICKGVRKIVLLGRWKFENADIATTSVKSEGERVCRASI